MQTSQLQTDPAPKPTYDPWGNTSGIHADDFPPEQDPFMLDNDMTEQEHFERMCYIRDNK